MTKFVKMSLAAAVAVAGFSSTASAQALEDAIKGVSVSGKIEVEYDRTTSDTGVAGTTETTDDVSDLDIDITFKAPVTDSITAIVALQADNSENMDDAGKTTYEPVDVPVHMFSVNTGVATINVGKQSIGSPFFDDEKGNGIVALVPAGPVTLAAAHMTNVNGHAGVQDEGISALAAIGSFGDVDVSLWYASITKVAQAYSLGVTAPAGPVTIDFRHSYADYGDGYATDGALYTGASADEQASLTKLAVIVPAGDVEVTAAYAMTGDNQSMGAGVDLESSDTDADSNFAGELYAIDDLRDASAFLLGASTTVGELGLGAHYLAGSYYMSSTFDADFNELYVEAEYPLGKMTKLTGFYAMGSIDTSSTTETDDTSMSIAIEHKF